MVKFGSDKGVYRFRRLEHGQKLEIRPLKGEATVTVGADIAFEVSTLEFPLEFNKIDGINKFIREEVVPRFSGFFPETVTAERFMR
jgi:hypothetical protein